MNNSILWINGLQRTDVWITVVVYLQRVDILTTFVASAPYGYTNGSSRRLIKAK